MLSRAVLFALSVTLACPVFASAPDEYTLKLVYLYNFTKFINWPTLEDKEQTEDQPFQICIMGSMPADSAMNALDSKRTRNNRPIMTSRTNINSDNGTCHILFITKSIPKSVVKKILAKSLRSTVTVGETKDFAKEGDIGFVIDERNHVKIEINLLNTSDKDINIRAPLIEIARKVYRAEGQS